MTDKQLRVLRRKHLLELVRDLKEALQNAIDEKEQLMLAYQCGMEREREETTAYDDSLPAPDWQQPMMPQQYATQYIQPQWPVQQQLAYPQPDEQQYPQPYAPWQPNPWQ